jgi:hypothetical protein
MILEEYIISGPLFGALALLIISLTVGPPHAPIRGGCDGILYFVSLSPSLSHLSISLLHCPHSECDFEFSIRLGLLRWLCVYILVTGGTFGLYCIEIAISVLYRANVQ